MHRTPKNQNLFSDSLKLMSSDLVSKMKALGIGIQSPKFFSMCGTGAKPAKDPLF